MSKTTFSGTGVNMTDTSIWSARKHKVCFKEERYDTRLWRDNVCGQVAELLAFLPRFSSKVSRKVLMKWSLPWNGLTKWLLQGEAGMSATSLPESLGTMVQTNGKRFQVSSSAYLWKTSSAHWNHTRTPAFKLKKLPALVPHGPMSNYPSLSKPSLCTRRWSGLPQSPPNLSNMMEVCHCTAPYPASQLCQLVRFLARVSANILEQLRLGV